MTPGLAPSTVKTQEHEMTNREKRIHTYQQEINNRPFSDFEGKLLKRKSELLNNSRAVNNNSQAINFNKFYSQYNHSTLEKIDPQRGIYKVHGIIPNTRIYIELQNFALSYYGASVVHELLSNDADYVDFELYVGTPDTLQTSAGSTHILFRPDFPLDKYPTSGQLIYAPATIYHEFGHTIAFTVTNGTTHDLNHETGILRILENPMRMEAGYEPRYTYTTRDGGYRTINVSTREQKEGRFRVKKDNSTVLVPEDAPDAFGR